MPTLRERRPVRRPTQYVVEERFKKHWTLVEKKKLLTGLRRYGNQNIEAIREKHLPHRTTTEINMFLVRMKMRDRTRPHVPKRKVPIELWTEMSEQLASGVPDYSTTLGDVMQKIENIECHDEKINREDPDWLLVYNYLSSLLKADELPELGQIEAGVVLDLLESLARHLTDLDVASQRRLVETKYQLLSTKVDANDKKRVSELAFQALENDLPQANGNVAAAAATTTSSETPPRATGSNAAADPTPSTSSQTVDAGQPGGPAAETRGDEERPETYLVKPLLSPLYSINPLCIPVKYLSLRPLPSVHN